MYLVRLIGRYEFLDEATKDMSRLDIGRIQVSMSSPEPVNKMVNIMINNMVFSVTLVEKVFVDKLVLTTDGGNSIPFLMILQKVLIHRWVVHWVGS